jgi:hypothetical protein
MLQEVEVDLSGAANLSEAVEPEEAAPTTRGGGNKRKADAPSAEPRGPTRSGRVPQLPSRLAD